MEFREQMKRRSKNIGVNTIRLIDTLPNTPVSWILSKQLIRSSTAIGANYRAAYRAKSTADFINKLKMVEEEADETIYWLELLTESGKITPTVAKTLLTEITEVLSIVVTSIKTSRDKR